MTPLIALHCLSMSHSHVTCGATCIYCLGMRLWQPGPTPGSLAEMKGDYRKQMIRISPVSSMPDEQPADVLELGDGEVGS